MQVKLLRVFQENEIKRIGAITTKKVDIRIIAATNKDIVDEVASSSFREDLFYRLAVAVLKLPPLRDRAGDLSLLIDKLLDQVNQESAIEPGYKDKKISARAKNLMLQHSWRGNVRELLNTLQRAAVWTSGDTIHLEDIKDALLPLSAADNNDEKILNRPISGGINLPDILKNIAVHYLKRALEETHGNKTEASKLLGLSNYQTLSNWLKKYDVN
jgi:DNA-binding NtrC family response regulator